MSARQKAPDEQRAAADLVHYRAEVGAGAGDRSGGRTKAKKKAKGKKAKSKEKDKDGGKKKKEKEKSGKRPREAPEAREAEPAGPSRPAAAGQLPEGVPVEAVLTFRMAEILATVDLAAVTGKAVRRQLEQDLGVDLRPHKGFLKRLLNRFLDAGDPLALDAVLEAPPNGMGRGMFPERNDTGATGGGGEDEEEDEEAGEQEGGGGEPEKKKVRTGKWGLVTSKEKVGGWEADEDAALRVRVREWARTKGHDEEDLAWVVDKTGKGRKKHMGLWEYIQEGLPHPRNLKQIYKRAEKLFHPHKHKGAWTGEEDGQLLSLAQKRAAGAGWGPIGQLLERPPEACAERHRLLAAKKSGKIARGAWDEVSDDRLWKLVASALEKRVAGKGSTHQLLLAENLPWTKIAQEMGDRTPHQCLERYYGGVFRKPEAARKTMVQKGEWGENGSALEEDRLLLLALREGQHKFEGAVDWGGLVAGRSADTARRRFKVLKKCVPASVKRQAFPAVLAHLFRTYLRED